MTRDFRIAVVVLCVGVLVAFVAIATRQPRLPDGIVLCEVAGEIARCEMIAGKER